MKKDKVLSFAFWHERKRTTKMVSYEVNVVGWAHEQAALIRAGRFEHLDFSNICRLRESLIVADAQEYALPMSKLLIQLYLWRM